MRRGIPRNKRSVKRLKRKPNRLNISSSSARSLGRKPASRGVSVKSRKANVIRGKAPKNRTKSNLRNNSVASRMSRRKKSSTLKRFAKNSTIKRGVRLMDNELNSGYRAATGKNRQKVKVWSMATKQRDGSTYTMSVDNTIGANENINFPTRVNEIANRRKIARKRPVNRRIKRKPRTRRSSRRR